MSGREAAVPASTIGLERRALRIIPVQPVSATRVPDDATVEDVMDRLYFLSKVARGLEATEQEQLIPHEDIEREFLPGA